MQVLLFIAFSVVENTFSDTFEVRFHARVDLFLPQFIIVLQLYERTKHDHIDRNVCFLFVKIKCILLLLKLNSAFIQLFIHLVWTLIFISPHSLRIIIFLGVELCWNIYPSTAYSSLLLLFLHISVLLGIWFSPTEYPYIDKRT